MGPYPEAALEEYNITFPVVLGCPGGGIPVIRVHTLYHTDRYSREFTRITVPYTGRAALPGHGSRIRVPVHRGITVTGGPYRGGYLWLSSGNSQGREGSPGGVSMDIQWYPQGDRWAPLGGHLWITSGSTQGPED